MINQMTPTPTTHLRLVPFPCDACGAILTWREATRLVGVTCRTDDLPAHVCGECHRTIMAWVASAQGITK